VTAINAGPSAVDTAHVSGDVELAPSAAQTTSSTNALIDLKLIGSTTLGTPNVNPLLRLSASGSYNDGGSHDQQYFRVDNNGNIVAFANYDAGLSGSIPAENAGTRFMWYGSKAAIRAGGVEDTSWDDASTGLYSTAFGQNDRANGDASVAMGKASIARGFASFAMGEGTNAAGYASVALGYGASTANAGNSPRNGTFVFSDFSSPITYPSGQSTFVDITTQFHANLANTFNVRAVNGSFFYTNTALTTGLNFNSTTANLILNNSKLAMASDGSTTLYSNSSQTSGVILFAGGGSWNSVSDRNMKENFADIDGEEILRRLRNVPILSWNYKAQNARIRHIGPMAQDFMAAFHVGEDDKHISTIDPDGIALAGVKALDERTLTQQQQIDALRQENAELRERLLRIEKLLLQPEDRQQK
jgi:hypothetical protein